MRLQRTALELIPWYLESIGPDPVRRKLLPPFEGVDLSRGKFVAIAGAPGAGKTVAALQIAADVVRSECVVIANAEMPPAALLDRIFANLTGIPARDLHSRQLSGDSKEYLRKSIAKHERELERISFLEAPFTIERAIDAARDRHNALLVVDYLQLFGVQRATASEYESLTHAVVLLRGYCASGGTVLALSSLSRQGGGYNGAGLSSFKGSGGIESAIDQGWIVEPRTGGPTEFRCVKHRYDAPENFRAWLVGDRQIFSTRPTGSESRKGTAGA